jgi:hypothetical protein
MWSDDFVKTGTVMPYRQGKHQKTDSLINDPDVRQALLTILRSQCAEIIDSRSFSKWISEQLHQNDGLCLLQPVMISELTVRRWLHLIGFRLPEAQEENLH